MFVGFRFYRESRGEPRGFILEKGPVFDKGFIRSLETAGPAGMDADCPRPPPWPIPNPKFPNRDDFSNSPEPWRCGAFRRGLEWQIPAGFARGITHP